MARVNAGTQPKLFVKASGLTGKGMETRGSSMVKRYVKRGKELTAISSCNPFVQVAGLAGKGRRAPLNGAAPY